MPNKKNANYINKPFMLNLDDETERELYEWLQKQPRGDFKRKTKSYWIKKMKEDKHDTRTTTGRDIAAILAKGSE